MKKYLTLANALKCGALVFGLVAFFLMFANPHLISHTDVGIGTLTTTRDFQQVLFGADDVKPAVLSTIGYFLILVFALGSVGLIFAPLEAKIKKYCFIGLGVLFIMAAVFVFVEAAVYNSANDLDNFYQLNGAPIVTGILAIVAGLLVAGSEFVPEMQLVK